MSDVIDRRYEQGSTLGTPESGPVAYVAWCVSRDGSRRETEVFEHGWYSARHAAAVVLGVDPCSVTVVKKSFLKGG